MWAPSRVQRLGRVGFLPRNPHVRRISSASSLDGAIDHARRWAALDPNPATAAAALSLADARDGDALAAAGFGGDARLQFGTAGIRGRMDVGPLAMNDLTVLQTTQGLCLYLEQEGGGGAADVGAIRARGVAIGHDHRASAEGAFGGATVPSSAHALSSRRFALLAAAVCAGRGFAVQLYRGLVATPLVPFCVGARACAAGVMVTASHNPKEDNGYKVYWRNGAQIVAPHDAGIAAGIDACAAAADDRHAAAHASTGGGGGGGGGLAWPDGADIGELLAPSGLAFHGGDAAALDAFEARLRAHPLVHDPTEDVGAAYVASLAGRLSSRRGDAGEFGGTLGAGPSGGGPPAPAPCVYTAMHGVGHAWVDAAFDACGLPRAIPVDAQCAPDPAFPTVPNPNPEEGAGALALAFEAADAAGVTLVLANDPDADRLAVAERQPGPGGGWRVFTGNEVGALLGHWQWRRFCARHWRFAHGGSPAPPPAAMLASTVSSKMLRAMGRAENFAFEETLTGFKWMGNRAESLRAEGVDVLFAYEAEIGFCVGDLVKDKDGVAAAAVCAEMAAQLAHDQAPARAGEGLLPALPRDQAGRDAADGRDALARAACDANNAALAQHDGAGALGPLALQLSILGDAYGHFAATNGYALVDDQRTIAAIFERLRGPPLDPSSQDGQPYAYWDAVESGDGGGWAARVTNVRDLTPPGFDAGTPSGAPALPLLPPGGGEMVTWDLALPGGEECVCTLRTSGTEPKVKFYVEVAGRPGQGADEVAAVSRTTARRLVDEMLTPEVHGLALTGLDE